MTWTIQGERQQGTKQFLPMTFWGGVYLSFLHCLFPLQLATHLLPVYSLTQMNLHLTLILPHYHS